MMVMASCVNEFNESDVFLEDLLNFLTSKRKDIKTNACRTVTQLTGSKDGLEVLYKKEKLLNAVINLIDDADAVVAEDSLRTLINLSAEEEGSNVLLSLGDPELYVVEKLVECIKNVEYIQADLACGVLANLTRLHSHCKKVFEYVMEIPGKLDGLVYILGKTDYNTQGSKLHHLAAVISNFTQISEGRNELLNREKCIFERLLPFIEYSDSELRRKSVIAAIHNCCFEKDYHEWLLSEKIDIASRLALPLAGPDVYTEEENDSLPLDLQYLPDDKKREVDPELRILLLESFMQLCTTKYGRIALRASNIYLILREHHIWETDERCTLLNEDVVNLLLKTEDEIGEKDLSTLEIPSHLVQKFTDFESKILEEANT